MHEQRLSLARRISNLFTSERIFILLIIALFIGITLDHLDPLGTNFTIINKCIVVLVTILFVLFACSAFAENRRSKQNQRK